MEAELTIISQVFLRVNHCLFSQGSLDQIKEVRSKDQALAQCAEWLRTKLPHAELATVSSTAEAVKECQTSTDVAAIAGELAGTIYDVPLIEKGIQDRSDNITPLSCCCKKASANTGWYYLPDKLSDVA